MASLFLPTTIASGVGKSTLLKTLCGLIVPASGAIEFDGKNIAGLPAPDVARMGIGYVPQGRGLFAGMTVADNLALGRLARKTDGSDGVVWNEAKIFDYFPRLKERINNPGRLPVGRRAADGRGRPRLVGQRQIAAVG